AGAAAAAPLDEPQLGAEPAEERLAGPADPGFEVEHGALPAPGGLDGPAEQRGADAQAPHLRVHGHRHVGVVAVLRNVDERAEGARRDRAGGAAVADDPAPP